VNLEMELPKQGKGPERKSIPWLPNSSIVLGNRPPKSFPRSTIGIIAASIFVEEALASRCGFSFSVSSLLEPHRSSEPPISIVPSFSVKYLVDLLEIIVVDPSAILLPPRTAY